MNPLIIRISLTVIMLLSLNSVFAQDFSDEIPSRLEKLNAEKENQSEEVVINTNMIERFYRLYDEIEVVSWRQMLHERGYDSTLMYMQAYQNMNLNEIDISNLHEELDSEVKDRALKLEQDIYRPHPITSADTQGTDGAAANINTL